MSSNDNTPLLDDVIKVLEHVDENGLLNEKRIPSNFSEEDPDKILESYAILLSENKHPKTASVLEKYRGGKYTTFYQLYHDIKVACASKIKEFNIGSSEYNEIDSFHKFSSELIMRELNRIKEDPMFSGSENGQDESEIAKSLSDDFNKISHSYSSANNEAILYVSQAEETNELSNPMSTLYPNYQHNIQPPRRSKQPLFSSLLGKSTIDSRSTMVPDPYKLTKIVPSHKNFLSNNNTLETLSPSTSKIPSPTNQPTEILSNFFHPNWYTIQIPSWLTYKSRIMKPQISSCLLKSHNENELRQVNRNDPNFSSFAPSLDSKVGAVSKELEGNVWLNHLGFKKLKNIEKDTDDLNGDQTSSDDQLDENIGAESQSDVAPSDQAPEKRDDYHHPSDVQEKIDSENVKSESPGEINIANVLKWDPAEIEDFKVIKNEHQDILKSSKLLQNVISKDLLKLNQLRQERYLRSNPSNIIAPSSSETRLYKKITKLLTLLLDSRNVGIGNLSLQLSKKVPVLLNEYHGTLPGMQASKVTTTGSKTTRLPSIRGPYKKKNRQL
ncbi:Piso0_000889 [Millerozyma farinosa CBS 7064]|uniref:Piso0_000889 protein n=1 Tax=Pichia sorbitophila (strain ATCC MYA-4447 / BCRC 22081 / CBS 7064 / NBRC 10061 / NRRL Y-12695) TaxID=559304 RepID=G8YQC2_PICSO|nr:Piso0_000889 [Millerozyma farinosa CBS 7064]